MATQSLINDAVSERGGQATWGKRAWTLVRTCVRKSKYIWAARNRDPLIYLCRQYKLVYAENISQFSTEQNTIWHKFGLLEAICLDFMPINYFKIVGLDFFC